jgi:hypothetical protein
MFPAPSWSAVANSAVRPGETAAPQFLHVEPLSVENEMLMWLPVGPLRSHGKYTTPFGNAALGSMNRIGPGKRGFRAALSASGP